MPTFRTENFDLEPWEYLEECTHGEIVDLIKALEERDYLKPNSLKQDGDNEVHGSTSVNQQIFEEKLESIKRNRLNLSFEEEEMIDKIAERFKFL